MGLHIIRNVVRWFQDNINMKIKKTVAFLSNIGYTVRAYIL